MNKRVSIFAIALIVVGIIGSVWTGLDAVPAVINFALEKEEESNREHRIYEKNVEVNNISAYTQFTNIQIKKHDEKTVKVTRRGNDPAVNYTIEENGNTLEIKESINNSYKNYKVKNFEDLFNKGMDEMFSRYDKDIIVYVPNDVDINSVTEGGNLFIKDDVFLNNISFKTRYGSFISGVDPKEKFILDKLEIVSSEGISLKPTELLGIKNIKIDALSVNIHSDNEDILVNNPERFIADNMDIRQYKGEVANGSSINIESNIPIAKNLNIDSIGSDVELKLPIKDYKFNFNMNSNEIIDLSHLFENSVLSRDGKFKDNNLKQINGVLNEKLLNLENQYNVNINAKAINIH